MQIKIINNKLNDSFILETETIEEIRKEAKKETDKRNWKEENCHSEKIN